jgi:hypothetical protein
VVLALLCMNFRPDWQPVYDRLAAEPEPVQSALDATVQERGWPETVWLAGTQCPLPADLVDYLDGLARPVLRAADITAYVSVAESTWSTDPWVLKALTVVSKLRGTGDELVKGTLALAEAARRIAADAERLDSLIGTRHESSGRLTLLRGQLQADVAALMGMTRELMAAAEANSVDFRDKWTTDAVPVVEALDARLLDWHRYVSLSG